MKTQLSLRGLPWGNKPLLRIGCDSRSRRPTENRLGASLEAHCLIMPCQNFSLFFFKVYIIFYFSFTLPIALGTVSIAVIRHCDRSSLERRRFVRLMPPHHSTAPHQDRKSNIAESWRPQAMQRPSRGAADWPAFL